mmetsp:Transcript_15865/g.43881  ORF Transcript_15865/g.43881 Transcript_15865/m.43881 type:complete len:361 (+) Transcript_15865:245-1327(+)|eukprot:CAMPEP_0172369278 /NCGR_PEP_ID=MMETSP1060-20121228/31919_1 /TAXON_ID=37318 /ORGANISM="Pseudo-nitzschia pungens, Strain cf. cingulata" /LENGTH=360 /DNA_ID=CAMNT_0013094151 /DNA_START=239 /DNA_END=1321 /DNA_ORIENTATION=-
MSQSPSNASKANVDFFSTSTFKLILLVGMVLQNSATVLVGRYTRSGVRLEDQYVVNHLIVVTELGKLFLSCVFEYVSTNGGLLKSIQDNIIDRPYDAFKIMIPALLYLVQNTLLYVALANLTAPLFQVTYQAKLVTTAIVSVIMLNRKYSPQQWVCLVALSVGVAVVVLDRQENKAGGEAKTDQSLGLGLISVTVACLSSALAGVYFEKVVKNPSGGRQMPVSVWMRNIQLAFFSVVIAIIQGMMDGGHPEKASLSYFHGFTFWPCVLVCLQAGGGLLVAAVIKYADNVLKGLATGVSVCFATAVSFVLFGTAISGQFVVGASIILVSVYFFSNPIQKKDKSNSLATSNSATEMKTMLPK